MDTTGDRYSKKPLTKARAEKQKIALHINTGHGLYSEGGMMRVSNPLVPQVTPEQEARAVIQRILNSANSARSMSITMAEGHKSMEKIMNEAALELFKAGKSGAVKYLNDLRAPYESREDYKKDDSVERNKIAKEMGLEIKYGGSRKNYCGRFSEPDTHILIGDELVGGIAVKLIKNADNTYSIVDMKDKVLEIVSTKAEAEAALTKWYKHDPSKVVHKPIAKRGGPINWGEGLRQQFVRKYLKGQGIPATKKNVAKICNIMDVEGVVFE